MSYYYPQPVAPPVIPATLPPNPLLIAGTDVNYGLTTDNDFILVYGSNVGIYLPPCTSVKSKLYHIKLWAGSLTIYPSAGEYIDNGGALYISMQYQSRTLIPWPGSGWMCV